MGARTKRDLFTRLVPPAIEEVGRGEAWSASIMSTPRFPVPGPYGSSDGPSVTKVTGEQGTIQARYTAGKYGLTERVKVVATRPATLTRNRTIDALQGAERPELAIKVPGLVELGSAANHFAYKGGCPHTPNGDPADGVARYVTPEMGGRMTTLNDYYRLWTGNHLSFNDASLPYGGFFDNGGKGGMDSRCHFSHRRGIDIDVNRWDWAGDNNIRSTPITFDGDKQLLLNMLDRMAGLLQMERIPEDTSIHYRIVN